jgi:hypothetical protein
MYISMFCRAKPSFYHFLDVQPPVVQRRILDYHITPTLAQQAHKDVHGVFQRLIIHSIHATKGIDTIQARL